MNDEIILASKSYVKNYLMKLSCLPYKSIDPAIDETVFDYLVINERVQELAKLKAKVVSQKNPEAFVIGADTLTRNVQTGEIYAKPKDSIGQRQQALSISGATIENITGISIWYRGKEVKTDLTISYLHYQHFLAQTYDRLAQDDKPERRSSVLGMFIDSAGFTLLDKVEGSYTGAMGLPMEVVYTHIDSLKIKF